MNACGRDGLESLSGLSSLDDPVRQELYRYVASRDDPVTRDDAAAATGISRTLAAYHLDKLADAEILSVSYARAAGRVGPGAGRPAKRYTRSRQELAVSVPPRNYGLLADLLVSALSGGDAGAVHAAVAGAAQHAGQAGAAEHGILGALREWGYEPELTDGGRIELRNCPFERLARQHTEVVCDLNLHLIQGMLAGVGEPIDRAVLAPRAGRCCVAVTPARVPRGTQRSQPHRGAQHPQLTDRAD